MANLRRTETKLAPGLGIIDDRPTGEGETTKEITRATEISLRVVEAHVSSSTNRLDIPMRDLKCDSMLKLSRAILADVVPQTLGCSLIYSCAQVEGAIETSNNLVNVRPDLPFLFRSDRPFSLVDSLAAIPRGCTESLERWLPFDEIDISATERGSGPEKKKKGTRVLFLYRVSRYASSLQIRHVSVST